MRDRLVILANRCTIFACCRERRRVSSARVVRTRCRAPFACVTRLAAHGIKPFIYDYSCELISYLFNHQLLKW
jgi:hypothetical protein